MNVRAICHWVWGKVWGKKKKDQKALILIDKVVEAAGIEPASASPLPSILHAYPFY